MANINKQQTEKKIRKLKGVITSTKMMKTVVVKVSRLKKQPKYKTFFKVSRKFKAHVGKGQYQEGDKVVIEETRPLSKDKRWKVVRKI